MKTKLRILITGGLGRLGIKAALTLAGFNYPLTLVDINIPPDKMISFSGKDSIRVVQEDVFTDSRMEPLLREHEVVIHLACTTVPGTSEQDPIGDIQTNVIGTLTLFQASQRAGVQHFVFPSSGGTVYGNAAVIPTPENAPLQPISYHGAMKLAAEHYLRAAEQHGDTVCTILRISNPYGMGISDKPQGAIDTFVSRLRAGQPLEIWGDGHVVRDYIHVDDVMRALALVVDKQPGGHTFNIGSGVGVSINDILSELTRYFDLSDKIVWQEARGFDVQRNILDIARVRRELGWEPSITLKEGIRRLAQ